MQVKLKKMIVGIVLVFMVSSFPTAFASEETDSSASSPASISLVSVSELAALPGQWDYIGSSTFTSSSAIAYSTGGDFAFCLYSGPKAVYELWEDDPGNSNNDYVGKAEISKNQCGIVRGIGNFVDGDNKRAEFYVKKIGAGGSATIDFWD